MVQSTAGAISVIPIVYCCYAGLIRDKKLILTWTIVFVTSFPVIKLVVTFQAIFVS